MSMHWVVVADASRARIISGDDRFDSPEQVCDLHEPDARTHTSDLVSGPRGSTWAGPNGPGSAMERHSDPHRVASERFAARIAEELARGLHDRQLERVVLCAPAHFLGALREALSEPVRRAVVGSITRDWTAVAMRDLPQRIRDALPEDAGLPPEVS
jgi:protein required for attachment to host cells